MQSSHTYLKAQQRRLRAMYKEKLRAAVWHCAVAHAEFLREPATKPVPAKPCYLLQPQPQPMPYADVAGIHGERIARYAQARPASVSYKQHRTLQQ